jgi:hypothetical protein
MSKRWREAARRRLLVTYQPKELLRQQHPLQVVQPE